MSSSYHRLGAVYPRVRLRDVYPMRRRPRIPTSLLISPAEARFVWPSRRRKREVPDVRRRRKRLIPAEFLTPPAPPSTTPTEVTWLAAAGRRRPRRDSNTRRRRTLQFAWLFVQPSVPSWIVQTASTRRPWIVRPRTRRRRRSTWWIHDLPCTDPSFAAATFLRSGPAASNFIHQSGVGGTAEFGAATFVRSGPASSTLYRDRCDCC